MGLEAWGVMKSETSKKTKVQLAVTAVVQDKEWCRFYLMGIIKLNVEA